LKSVCGVADHSKYNPLLQGTYEKGVKLKKREMKKFEQQLKRSETLPKWDVQLEPQNP